MFTSLLHVYTCFLLELALDSLFLRWNHIEEKCDLPREEFLDAVRFILNSTFFTFNCFYYKATFGIPMGSPLSPIIADLTLRDLEKKAIAILSFPLPFYTRYVDDIVLAVPSSMLNNVLTTFNSFHSRLQFTMKEGNDNRLNFLDVTIMVNNNLIKFDWYHKPTFSGRFLNFESQHPLCVP